MTTYITQEQAIELAESTTLLGCDFSDFEAAIHRTCNAAIQAYRKTLVAGVVLPEPFSGEQSVFEDWLHDCAPSGDVESVQAKWRASYEYRDFLELHEYTADQLRQAVANALAKQVPQGYRLVPVEPDEHMETMGDMVWMCGARDVYMHMIAEAPDPKVV